jgi:general secretion pathway protein C
MAAARPYASALELALLAAIAALAALGVNAALRVRLADVSPSDDGPVAAPVAAPLPPLADFAVIAERDVFNAGRTTAPGAQAGALRLRGVGLHGGVATAAIEDTAAHRQDLYHVGDTVAGAQVAAIDWDRVTLARGGVEDVLELAGPESGEAPEPASDAAPADVVFSPDARIRQTSANAWVVDRRELTGAADNMSGLMTQLRAVAEEQDGRPAGFRLFQITDQSLFHRLGLQNGDVVRRVNGTPLADPTALLGFLQRLQTEPRVAVDIVRGGAARTLVYEIR